jgi:chromosome partitioning protein
MQKHLMLEDDSADRFVLFPQAPTRKTRRVGEIISFVAAAAGTGASTLARAFAVEAAYAQNLVIADLDELQHASWDWGQRRAAAGLDPAIPVERVPHAQALVRAAEIELLVVDTPCCADERISALAKGSRLTVVCTRSNIADVDLSIRLMHQLRESGIPDWRLAPALCRVQDQAESTFAREHLRRAGYDVLKGEVTESRSFEGLQSRGRAVTESPVTWLVQETLELVSSIQGAFVAALDRP